MVDIGQMCDFVFGIAAAINDTETNSTRSNTNNPTQNIVVRFGNVAFDVKLGSLLNAYFKTLQHVISVLVLGRPHEVSFSLK